MSFLEIRMVRVVVAVVKPLVVESVTNARAGSLDAVLVVVRNVVVHAMRTYSAKNTMVKPRAKAVFCVSAMDSVDRQFRQVKPLAEAHWRVFQVSIGATDQFAAIDGMFFALTVPRLNS